MAVYDHAHLGPAMQSRQVFAILFHELDHASTTDAQKLHYHQYCGDWCRFTRWIKAGNPVSGYSHDTSNWLDEKDKPWVRGIFAGIDFLYHDAFQELVDIFKTIGNQDLMKRCSIRVTTNVCESAHARLHTVVKKSSHRGLPRITFAGQQIMLNSSFGHQKASLDCVLGTMSTLARKHLADKQKDSLRVAKRTHVHQTNIFDGSRLKRSSNANVLDRRAPGLQCEPLDSDANRIRSAYIGGGQAVDFVDELESESEQE